MKGIKVGSLCIKFPWPGIARTIWGDHQRYKDTYFQLFQVNILLEMALAMRSRIL
jgi:acyl-coenzyme A synthetase/AMP-(fatty) acid ligase